MCCLCSFNIPQESAWTSLSQLQLCSHRRHRLQSCHSSSHKTLQVRLQLNRSRYILLDYNEILCLHHTDVTKHSQLFFGSAAWRYLRCKWNLFFVWQPVQPATAAGAETAAAAAAIVSPVTKADVQAQAQPIVQQQTTPSTAVATASQPAAQTPSSPAPPQRPARRRQASQAQQPAAQSSPSKATASQQQITQPSAAQAQPTSSEISQKAVETVSGLVLTNQLQKVSKSHHPCRSVRSLFFSLIFKVL